MRPLSRSSAAWILSVTIWLPLVCDIGGIPVDNGVVDEPSIGCFSDGARIDFQTENEFQGRLFVKGYSDDGDCVNAAAPQRSRNASLGVSYDSCGVTRRRTSNPRGVVLQTTVIIQFHPVFLTKVDRAYLVKCFYMEAAKTVDSQLDVSMLTTARFDAQFPMPVCSYSIREGSFDGPPVQLLRVGDPIFHRWECRNANNPEEAHPYGMLVHSCFVSDGSGNQVLLVDKLGCAMDPYILGHITYSDDVQTAFREAHVFKFADRNQLLFECQIRLCVKSMQTCDGMTPPNCLPLKNKRSLADALPDSHDDDDDEFDVQTANMVVFERLELTAYSKDAGDEEVLTNWAGQQGERVCLTLSSAWNATALLTVLFLTSLSIVLLVALHRWWRYHKARDETTRWPKY